MDAPDAQPAMSSALDAQRALNGQRAPDAFDRQRAPDAPDRQRAPGGQGALSRPDPQRATSNIAQGEGELRRVKIGNAELSKDDCR